MKYSLLVLFVFVLCAGAYGRKSRKNRDIYDELDLGIDRVDNRKLPVDLLREIEKIEHDLPEELQDGRWKMESSSPIKLSKRKTINEDGYHNKFSAHVSRSKKGSIDLYYEGLRCREEDEGQMEVCTNIVSNCKVDSNYQENCASTSTKYSRRLSTNEDDYGRRYRRERRRRREDGRRNRRGRRSRSRYDRVGGRIYGDYLKRI